RSRTDALWRDIREGSRRLVSNRHDDSSAARTRASESAMISRLALAAATVAMLQQPAPFRVETRLVVLQATVKNNRGELVTGLTRDAFTVWENGKRQAIVLFANDDVPVSLGLLIDNSGSMRSKRAKVEAAARDFARASNPQDEMFVLNFADKSRIDVPMTG